MTKVMNKANFCSCLETLCKYSSWENLMYNNGLDFSNTPLSDVTEKLQLAMCGFDIEWSYDKKLEFDWIIEWAFNTECYRHQIRHGREWDLADGGILYDFLVFMNESGWED